jgi:hypothetical protein
MLIGKQSMGGPKARALKESIAGHDALLVATPNITVVAKWCPGAEARLSPKALN